MNMILDWIFNWSFVFGFVVGILGRVLYTTFSSLFIKIPSLIIRHFNLDHWNVIEINDRKYLLTTEELRKLEKDNPDTYFFHYILHETKMGAKHRHKDAERYKPGD